MSETVMDLAPRRRRLLYVATAGVTLILLVFLMGALVLFDKEQFGWLVTWQFLPATSIAAMLGSLAIIVAVFMLPERATWAGRGVMLWALIGLVSPAFGFLFLAPWGLMLITAPLVIWALRSWFTSASALPIGS
jgi:hypothetical protein